MTDDKLFKTSESDSIDVSLSPPTDTSKPRVGRDSEGTKRDILLAAMHEFSEYGDGGARIDRIAKRANANKSLIYSYFGNKEELYARVLREAYAQIRLGEHELNLDQLDPRDAIRALMKFTMEHYLRAPWFLRLLATENLRRGQTVKQIENISELQSPLINQLKLVLDRGVADGFFRDDIEPVDLYILMASLFYFPISNSHTLPVVFQAQVNEPKWREYYLKTVQDMVVGHLECKSETK